MICLISRHIAAHSLDEKKRKKNKARKQNKKSCMELVWKHRKTIFHCKMSFSRYERIFWSISFILTQSNDLILCEMAVCVYATATLGNSTVLFLPFVCVSLSLFVSHFVLPHRFDGHFIRLFLAFLMPEMVRAAVLAAT